MKYPTDKASNTIFTSMFALSGVVFISLLVGFILIERISQLERFRKIDMKKEGRAQGR